MIRFFKYGEQYIMENAAGWWEWRSNTWFKYRRKQGTGAGTMVYPSDQDRHSFKKVEPLEVLIVTGYSVNKAGKFNSRDL